MGDNFQKIDLHIHTPCSKDYKGNKDDSEFIRIVQKAKKDGLKIIAITDHNSLEGYKKIIAIKDGLLSEKRTLNTITDSEQSKNRLGTIEAELSTFKDILILPGMEFQVRPGIHILIVFSNEIRTEEIDKLLIDGGFGPEEYGECDPATLGNLDVLDLFDKCKNFDCLVIDAHTDSNKGILNTTEKGMYRASCFKSPQLNAVCYKSVEQAEKLKSVLETAKEYKRQTPLAFVQFSDAHKIEEIGVTFSWARLEKITFENLKAAFANPSELISVEQPSLIKILGDILSKENTVGVVDLSSSNQEILTKYICCLHNSIGGNILLGVNAEKKIIGLSLTPKSDSWSEEQLEPVLRKIFDCIKNIIGNFKYKFGIYPLQKNRIVLSLHIPQGNNLISITGDGNIYSLKEGKITILSAEDTQAFVEEKLSEEIRVKIDKRVLEVERDCHLIRNLFSAMPIIRLFNRNSVRGTFDFEVDHGIKLNSSQITKLNKAFANGRSKGNLFYFPDSYQPRLQYTYLRYSLPLFNLKNIDRKSHDGETIYLVPGGGMFYANKDYPVFSKLGRPVLKLHATPQNSRYGMKFLCCFLKSSFTLWYCLHVFDDCNIYTQSVFQDLKIPILNTKDITTSNNIGEIEKYFTSIMDIERKYLIGVSKIKKEQKEEYTEKHNIQVDIIAHQIDCEIYKLLKFDDSEIALIEDDLRLNGIYLPKISPI
ncbi:MAG TPA: RNA-binding domain-containing protein [Dehalococcoidales bacterium]